MPRFSALIALASTLFCTVSVQAQTLAANATSNNGTGGVFLNLTPATTTLQIDSFQTIFASTAGTVANVEVWTRPGTYSGFTASNVGWTLSQTVSITSAGSTTLAPITLTTPIPLPFGDSTSVYIHGVTAGSGLRYFGSGTTSVTAFSNADLSLLTDIARTGAVAFGGSQFTPRAFTGTITYSNPVPEPACMAGLGIIAIAFVRRSRKPV